MVINGIVLTDVTENVLRQVGSVIGAVALVAVLLCYLARRKRTAHEPIEVTSETCTSRFWS